MEQLERQAVQRCGEAPGLSLEGAREAVAAVFEFPSWEEMREEVERRGVLNRCNLPEARARSPATVGGRPPTSRAGVITAWARRR